MKAKNIFVLCLLIVGLWAQTVSLNDFIKQKKASMIPNCVKNSSQGVCIECAEGYHLTKHQCEKLDYIGNIDGENMGDCEKDGCSSAKSFNN